MTNQTVKALRESIGKKIENSPSNVGNFLNGKLLQVDRGHIKIEYIVREEMLNPIKILHGGIISTMIDDCIGMATFTLENENFHTTINLQVDFLASATLGDKMIADAKIVKEGKQILRCECVIHNSEGKMIAKGNSNALVIDTKITNRVN